MTFSVKQQQRPRDAFAREAAKVWRAELIPLIHLPSERSYSIARFRSSCSKAEAIRSISADDKPTDFAVSRHRATAVLTSRATDRA